MVTTVSVTVRRRQSRKSRNCKPKFQPVDDKEPKNIESYIYELKLAQPTIEAFLARIFKIVRNAEKLAGYYRHFYKCGIWEDSPYESNRPNKEME
jgi:hypothetical protein